MLSHFVTCFIFFILFTFCLACGIFPNSLCFCSILSHVFTPVTFCLLFHVLSHLSGFVTLVMFYHTCHAFSHLLCILTFVTFCHTCHVLSHSSHFVTLVTFCHTCHIYSFKTIFTFKFDHNPNLTPKMHFLIFSNWSFCQLCYQIASIAQCVKLTEFTELLLTIFKMPIF